MPNPNFSGTDTFTYQFDDGCHQSNVATVTITVNPVNDIPVANDDEYHALIGGPPIIIDVLQNDVDVDGSIDRSSIAIAGLPAGAVDLGNGFIEYTPGATTSFTYTVMDDQGAVVAAPATVTINVTPGVCVGTIDYTAGTVDMEYGPLVPGSIPLPNVDIQFDHSGMDLEGNEEARAYTASDEAYVAILAPDLDLNLAKGILAVNTQRPGGQIYAQDATNNTNDGLTPSATNLHETTDPWAWFGHQHHLNNPFHDGSAPVAGDGEDSQLPITGLGTNAPTAGAPGYLNPQGNLSSTAAPEMLDDLEDGPRDASGNYTETLAGISGTAVSAANPVVPRTVEFQVQSKLNAHYVAQDPSNHTEEVMIIRDLGGANKAANEGYLYLAGIDTTGDGVPDQPGDETHTPIGFINYDTGAVTFDNTLFNQENEQVQLDYDFTRNRTAVNPNPVPPVHDLLNGRGTVEGEGASTGDDTTRVTITAEDGDIHTAGTFNVTEDQLDSGTSTVDAGTVVATINDRHGDIVLTETGGGAFDAIEDEFGNDISAAVRLDASVINYAWADGGNYTFETTELHSVTATYTQIPAGHPSGVPQNITSDYLHPDGITTNANGSLGGITNWNGFIDRDILNTVGGNTDLGVDAGDVITYGIVVENLGSDEVHDLRIDDSIFEGAWTPTGVAATSTGGTGETWSAAEVDGVGSVNPNTALGLPAAGALVDVTASLQSLLNLNVTRGDGAPVDFTAFYNPATGSIEFEIGADGTHNGATADNDGFALAGGRTNPGGNLDNQLGTNVLIITYDVELNDSWEALDRMTNVAEVMEYSYRDGGSENGSNLVGNDRNADGSVPATADKEDQGLRDEAIIEGRSADVNKILLSTDQAFTDDYRGTEAGYVDQHSAQADHAYNGATDTQTVGVDSGTDVAVGEQVVYGLIVEVPEGTINDLEIIDTLPPGLEFISARIVTQPSDLTSASYSAANLQAQSALTSTEFDLRAGRGGATSYGGTVPTIVSGPTAGATGNLTFDLGNLVNAHDANQDNTAIGGIDTITGHESGTASPIELNTNVASSERNNVFMIEITTRVLNDLEYNPATNGANPAATGTPDILPANGDPTNPGVPVDATGSPAGNNDGSVLANGVRLEFTHGVTNATETVNSDTSVNIEIVEPNLQITKVHNEADNVIELGKTVTYTVTISHTGSSTSDAFDVNLLDNMSLNSLLAQSGVTGTEQVTLQSLSLTSVPSYLSAGNIVTGGAAVTPPAGTTSATNLATDTIDLTFDRLELGDTITLQYEVFIGGTDAAADTAMVSDANNAGTNAPTSTTDPGPDIRNQALLTYYSVTDLTNVEVREYQTEATEDLEVVVPDIELNLVKGVLAVSPLQPAGQDFTADTTGNITNPAVSGGATGPGEDNVWTSGSGTITSGFLHPNLTTGGLEWNSAIDRNVIDGTTDMGVDAGDRVTYGVFVENIGSDIAHDIRISEQIAPGADGVVDGTIDLSSIRVYKGNGTTPLVLGTDYTVTATTNGFDLELIDEAVAGGRSTSGGAVDNATGDNVIYLTYDVVVGNGWQPEDREDNTATITQVKASDNAALNLLALPATVFEQDRGSLTDSAFVEGRKPVLNKVILSTDQAHTGDAQHNAAAPHSATNTDDSGTDVTIGEEISYGILIEIPEGTTNDLVVTDLLPAGLEFLSAYVVQTAADIPADATYTATEVGTQSGLTSTPFDPAGVTAYAGGGLLDFTGPAAGATGALVFDFGQEINLPESPTGDFASRSNNTFMLVINARVLNGVDDIDSLLQNMGMAVDTAGSGADIVGDGTEPFNEGLTGSTLQNTVSLTYTEGFDVLDDGILSTKTVVSETSVTVDLVEPELDVDKFVSNGGNSSMQTFYSLNDDGVVTTLDDGTAFGGGVDTDGDGTVNDFTVAGLGETLVYRVEFGHTGNSTSDAFDVRVHDVIDNMAADGFGSIVPGSVVIIDTVTNLPVTTGFTDNSTGSVVDVTIDQLALGQRYAVEFLVQLTTDPALLLERGGPDGIDILNTVDLEYYSIADNGGDVGVAGDDKVERRGRIVRDAAEVSVVAPDLNITKNDDIQDRILGEEYTYNLNWSAQANHDSGGFTEAGGPALNVVVTDLLPAELTFVSSNVTPVSVTVLPSGETEIVWNLGDMPGGTSGVIEVDVVVNADLPSGFHEIINNVSIGNDIAETESVDNADIDIDNITIHPDLFITKNDGVQAREPGEEYNYTLNFGNQEFLDDGTTPAGPATNTVITDTLPPELIFQSLTVEINGVAVAVTPTITMLPDGSTQITVNLGTLNAGDIGQLVMTVMVNPELPNGEYSIVNTVSIATDDVELDTQDNADLDEDFMVVDNVLFFGGSDIMQGFRFIERQFEEEEDEDLPILTLMPIYSGTADPGTTLRIRILGGTGESIPGGDQTVVADVGGNWLATFPALVLMDGPHTIVVEQTPPVWNLSNDRHGFNMRTYFAPGISPTHSQTEALDVGNVLARRLSGVVVDSMSSGDSDGASHSNVDWRLGNYERFVQSGIGGVLK